MLVSAKGIDGQLEVYEDKIIIKRRGVLSFISHGSKGGKERYIHNISSILFKKARAFLTSGYIQFTFSGGKEAKGGRTEALSDENSLSFYDKDQRDFEKAKSIIEENITKPKESQSKNYIADEIRKFTQLKEDGIITDEEFQKKKKDLLEKYFIS